MDIINNPEVAAVFKQYPPAIQEKLRYLKSLIVETAAETCGVENLEETLKWGEPGYLCKTGSTLRIAWKAANPDHYGMYFNCKTTLVETFKEIYPDEFNFSGNRAIIFDIDDDIPIEALQHCIALTLAYHQLKHLPMLGI